MAKAINLSFYRQQRRDGGVRTGIEIDDHTELGRFENEAEDSDPVLAWWVDLRCEGRKLPMDPESARRWFLEHAAVIHRGFQTLANEMEAGLDFNTWPHVWPVPGSPRGVRMAIACNASRRRDGLKMPQILKEIDQHWEELIATLPGVERLTTL
jgi:hypothetical protein